MRSSSIRRGALWTLVAVSAFVAIEPSPYEFLFAIVMVIFARSGFRFDRAMIPMIVTMAMFNAGGFVALAPYVDVRKSVTFTFITFYITVTMIAFAAIVADRPESRLATIRSGYVFSASIAALLGILGYFNIAGLGPYFTLYDGTRAAGPFKDPNVFGPFLVAPIVWLAQDVLLSARRPPADLAEARAADDRGGAELLARRLDRRAVRARHAGRADLSQR